MLLLNKSNSKLQTFKCHGKGHMLHENPTKNSTLMWMAWFLHTGRQWSIDK